MIRIFCLLLVAGFLARGSWVDVGALALLAGGLYLRAGVHGLAPLWRVLRRLRFLFLSIAVTYLWFTPGEWFWPTAGAWSPTREGLVEGLLRVAALVVLVAAVQLLMQSTARAELVGAIRWWAQPLRLFGLDPDRLALRLVLALETVPRLREIVAEQRRPVPAKGRLRAIGRFAGEVFTATVQAAERAEPVTVDVPLIRTPAPAQWLLPAALSALLVVV